VKIQVKQQCKPFLLYAAELGDWAHLDILASYFLLMMLCVKLEVWSV